MFNWLFRRMLKSWTGTGAAPVVPIVRICVPGFDRSRVTLAGADRSRVTVPGTVEAC